MNLFWIFWICFSGNLWPTSFSPLDKNWWIRWCILVCRWKPSSSLWRLKSEAIWFFPIRIFEEFLSYLLNSECLWSLFYHFCISWNLIYAGHNFIISYLFVRKICFFFKCDELASHTSKDLNFVFLPFFLLHWDIWKKH